MEFRPVLRVWSRLALVLAAAELACLPWCLFPFDRAAWAGLVGGAGVSASFGWILDRLSRETETLGRREAVLAVVGTWVWASSLGAVPYWLSGAIPDATDALFESVSGFTTTGASIVTDLGSFPRGLLLWRSLTQWLGGIGIVVLFVALLGQTGSTARRLFQLEVPGPKTPLIHPGVRASAVALLQIYLALSALQTGAMLALGSSWFDALTHTFATVSTGGFSPHPESAAGLTRPLQGVVLVFMLLSGANLALYASAVQGRFRLLRRNAELRLYLALAVVGSAVVAVDLAASLPHARANLIFDAVFQTVSVLTTTGFATADFDRWPGFAHVSLVGLMFFGGCAGSTAGGAKLARLLLGMRFIGRETRLVFQPKAVVSLRIGGAVVADAEAASAMGLVVLWGVAFGLGAVLLSVGDIDLVTAATASLATLSNIGPGLSAVGPAETYAFFAGWQKLGMILLMWLGRLEFLAVLALVLPRFWRD